MVEDSNIVQLSPNEVKYPLLISLYGETKKGKTFFGASFPNVVLLDFPPVVWKFKGVEIDRSAISRSVGEGFRSIFSPTWKSDGSVGWISKVPNFDFKNQYKFIKSWQEFQMAIEHARLFAESIPDGDGKCWVVIDDTNRWRGIEVYNWTEKNQGKWPAPNQFGQITQMMQGEITSIQEFANVLLISRMVKNFDTGEYGPQVYPTGSDYLADASIEIRNELDSNKKLIQVIEVHSNGHDFVCSPGYCTKIVNPTPVEVLTSLKIPMELW